MKKGLLAIILILFSLAGFSQAQSVYVAAYDTSAAGRPFWKMRLRPTYVQHPIIALNDSTYSFDSSRYYISSFAPNGSSDSLVITFINGQRLAALSSSGGSGWGLTGNAGTIFGTNFLGTTDDINLMFRRNNSISGVLDSNATGSGRTYFGVGAGANNTAINTTAFGFKALAANTSAASNTAFGMKALFASTTGSGANTAVGNQALMAGTTFSTNTAVGAGAMQNYTGNQNTSVGYNSLLNGSGNNNTALGREALGSGTVTGAQNTALGQGAGSINSSGAGNIFLGYSSGSFNTTVSSQLFVNSVNAGGTYIEQQNRSIIYGQQHATTLLTQYLSLNGKVGINTTAPTAFLHLTRGTTVANTAPMKFATPTVSLTTTAATGTGSQATLTFATTTTPAFVVGSTITVAGVTPAGYNGTFTVGTVTATTVTYANATTGAQTVAGTISQGALMTTPEAYAVENDANDLYYTNSAATRFTIAKVLKGSATLDFPSTLTLTSSDLTVTVTGAADGDVVDIGAPNASVVANSNYSAWVSAANTVTIRLNNYSVGSVNPASGVFNVKVFKD